MAFRGLKRQTMTLELWSQILPWRNDPLVYVWSKTNRVLQYGEHMAWFRERSYKINSEPIFAYFVGGRFVGMARLDKVNNECFEVSLIVNPNYRGLGYGKLILKNICEYFLAYDLMGLKLVAIVHSENRASLALFKQLGFTLKSIDNHFVTFEL